MKKCLPTTKKNRNDHRKTKINFLILLNVFLTSMNDEVYNIICQLQPTINISMVATIH